jgi:hypothetical protein
MLAKIRDNVQLQVQQLAGSRPPGQLWHVDAPRRFEDKTFNIAPIYSNPSPAAAVRDSFIVFSAQVSVS